MGQTSVDARNAFGKDNNELQSPLAVQKPNYLSDLQPWFEGTERQCAPTWISSESPSRVSVGFSLRDDDEKCNIMHKIIQCNINRHPHSSRGMPLNSATGF